MSTVIGFPLPRPAPQRRGSQRLRGNDGRQGADIVILPVVRIERHGSPNGSPVPDPVPLPHDGSRRAN